MTIDFKAFADNVGANVVSQADYLTLLGAALADGFEAGVAKSAEVNKVFRQSSVMTAAIANAISQMQNDVDVLDTDGALNTLISLFLAGVRAGGRYFANDSGILNAYVVALSPVRTDVVNGMVVTVAAAQVANTGASTLNTGAGVKAIKRSDGTDLQAGDIAVGDTFTVIYRTTGDAYIMTQLVRSQAGNPVGSVIDFAGSAAPNGYVLCDGSSLLRAGTYAALFAVIGTTFGAVDGSHFNVPDFRGRIAVGVGTGTTVETQTAVAAVANVVPCASNADKWITGMAAVLSGVSGFGGTIGNGAVFVVRSGATGLRFAPTLADAQTGTNLLTASGSGNYTLTSTLTARTLAQQGGEESHAMSLAELLNHSHQYTTYNTGVSGGTGAAAGQGGVISNPSTTTNPGGNAAMNSMQPYLAVNKCIKF